MQRGRPTTSLNIGHQPLLFQMPSAGSFYQGRRWTMLLSTLLAVHLSSLPSSTATNYTLNSSSREFLPLSQRVEWDQVISGCSSHCSVTYDTDLTCWQGTLDYFEKMMTGAMRQYTVTQVSDVGDSMGPHEYKNKIPGD